jgi:hypothetical protein
MLEHAYPIIPNHEMAVIAPPLQYTKVHFVLHLQKHVERMRNIALKGVRATLHFLPTCDPRTGSIAPYDNASLKPYRIQTFV